MSQFAEAYELGIFAQIVRLFEGAIAENGNNRPIYFENDVVPYRWWHANCKIVPIKNECFPISTVVANDFDRTMYAHHELRTAAMGVVAAYRANRSRQGEHSRDCKWYVRGLSHHNLAIRSRETRQLEQMYILNRIQSVGRHFVFTRSMIQIAIVPGTIAWIGAMRVK
jgi:hypothetical protein